MIESRALVVASRKQEVDLVRPAGSQRFRELTSSKVRSRMCRHFEAGPKIRKYDIFLNVLAELRSVSLRSGASHNDRSFLLVDRVYRHDLIFVLFEH